MLWGMWGGGKEKDSPSLGGYLSRRLFRASMRVPVVFCRIQVGLLPLSQPIHYCHEPLAENPPLMVALIVDTSLASGRNILRGITRYVHGHGLWNLFHCPEAIDKKVPAWLKDCENGGIIARVDNPTFAEALMETGAPVVDVLGLVPNTGFPVVQVDDEAIAALAFDRLAERGFRNFAFVGFRSEPWALGGRNWSERRRYVFAAKARAIRCDTQVFEFTAEQLKENSWEEREGHLAEWLQALPKPCGILVCNDQFGLDVLEACRRANVHVPDEVAVLGVDNDEPLCDVCTPPLSSVSPGHVGVGYQAAALLDTIMHGGKLRSKTKRVPPGGVVTRQSSEVLAVDDSAVALALRLIRERSCAGISVDEIARLLRHIAQRAPAALPLVPGPEHSRLHHQHAAETCRGVDFHIRTCRFRRSPSSAASSTRSTWASSFPRTPRPHSRGNPPRLAKPVAS